MCRRGDLRARRRSLTSIIAKLADHLRTVRDGSLCADDADNVQARLDVAIASAELNVVENGLSGVNTALNGRKRLCESCGKPIGTERLKAVPEATLCRECKSTVETVAAGGRPRVYPGIYVG